MATHQAVLDEKEREISEDGFKREELREEYYDAIRLRNDAAGEVSRLRNLQERVYNEHENEGSLDGDNLSELDQSSCEVAADGLCTVATRGAGAVGFAA
ncbi:hypothetical protein [Hyphococcus sp.]|uniref:hypothetical protein n=1 Tax=Hyphococcus sp. TaxID=2038636 RepID=UPI003CCC0C88